MPSEEQKGRQKCQKDSFSVKSHPCANIIDILPAIRPYVISNPLNHYTNASWKRPLKPRYETAKI